MDSFDILPSNVQVEALSYVANDRNVSWPNLLQLRKTSRFFNVEILKQLKNVKIVEKDYSSYLRKPCVESDKTKVSFLTSDFLRFFLPKISHALNEIFFTRSLLHEAAASALTIGLPESPETLDSVKTIHLLICSADCFNFVDILSRSTPAVETLILECLEIVCSTCVPHEMNLFWNAAQWNLTQLRRLAFVGFYPPEDYCCTAPPPPENILDPRLYHCSNLIALDLREDKLSDIMVRPLGTSFPELQELRLGPAGPANYSHILREVAACPNLNFLDLPLFLGSHRRSLNDPLLVNQLSQVLTRLTHLHIDLRGCDGAAFATFFGQQTIQLTDVAVTVSDDNSTSLIKDVIDGNPQLQVLIVSRHGSTAGTDTIFAGLPTLSQLKVFVCYILYGDVDHVPQFFSLLDPTIHPKLQVAALTLNCNSPEGFTGMIEQVQQRFAGHRVNGRPVEILSGMNFEERCFGDGVHKHIRENYPVSACCIEAIRLRIDEFRVHFSPAWKSA